MLAFAGAWIQTCYGEIVNADSMLHAPSYFEYAFLGNGGASEDSIAVDVGTSNYLKFVLQEAEQCFEYQDGTRSEMPDCYYGWLEYKVHDNGRFEILASAINLDGGGMIVGGGPLPIPEPSGVVLVLLGVAALFLRRRV